MDHAVQALADLSGRAEAWARANAARALEALGDPEAIPALMHALRDGDAEVRAAAARALVTLGKGSPEAQRGVRSVLRGALRDRYAAVRTAAREGLVALGVVEPARLDKAQAAARAAREALRLRLRAASAEEAAEILFERGRALAGRPLERAAWGEIARALRTARAGERVLELVVTATRREHVLRALRLARTAARPRRRAGAAAAAAGAKPRLSALLLQDGSDYEHEDYHDAECGCRACAPADPDAWRVYVRPRDLRVPGVLPVDAVQELVAACLDRTGSAPDATFTSLGARLGETRRAAIFEAFGDAQEHVPEEVRGFLARYGLEAWARAMEGAEPRPTSQERVVIRAGAELAAVVLLEQHALPRPAFEVDWSAVAAWLAGRLVQAPGAQGAERTAVAFAFFRFVSKAPHEAMRALRAAIARIDAGWLALLPWLHVRRGAAESRALMEASFGSTLVLHDVRCNLDDARAGRVPSARARWTSPRELLLNGGGTLRRMDYPAFQVVSRPAVSLVRPETAEAFAEMARELAAAHGAVASAGCRALLGDLLGRGGHGAFAGLPEPLQEVVARAIEEHVIAFVVLDNVVFASSPEPVRIRKKHVRRFWTAKPGPGDAPRPADLAALRERFDADRVKEGLVHALLDQMHEPWVEAPAVQAALKEGWIWLLRTIAVTYGIQPVAIDAPGEEPGAAAHRLADHLVQQVVHAPLELAQALGMGHEQGLPRLSGGHATALERQFRLALREATSSSRVAGEAGAEAAVFSCRPIPKSAAIDRGDLGRDCSTQSVPLRALSPHHVYYGVFQGETQRPGYMTVYEAWAEAEDGAARIPVLCLETINVPIDRFDPIQEDLVLIFEAIARSRGLHPHVVLITGIGTWNYQNGWLLAGGRRFRNGTPVRLFPADPVSWRLYEMTTGEAAYYSAFEGARGSRGEFRILAPFDPDLDRVQPENLEEARRIAAMKPKRIRITARTAEGAIGFISGWPEVI